MLTRTTITTDTTDVVNPQSYANDATDLQDWLDHELDLYMRTIIVPRIRRKFGITVTVEVS